MTPPIPIPRELLERLTNHCRVIERYAPGYHEHVSSADIRAAEAILGGDDHAHSTEWIVAVQGQSDPSLAPSPVHRITPENQPVFPCWLWNDFYKEWHRAVLGMWNETFPEKSYTFTYWSPDSPTAPQQPREAQ